MNFASVGGKLGYAPGAEIGRLEHNAIVLSKGPPISHYLCNDFKKKYERTIVERSTVRACNNFTTGQSTNIIFLLSYSICFNNKQF